MKEDEMNRVRGTYGGEEKGMKGFGAETGRNETTWKT
jgi:hypothetical protein